MRRWPHLADRADMLGLFYSSTAALTSSSIAQLSLSAGREASSAPFTSALWTVSEVAPFESSPSSERNAATRSSSHTSVSSTSSVVDVDASEQRDEREEQQQTAAASSSLVSSPLPPVRLRDAVVLSYSGSDAAASPASLTDEDEGLLPCASAVGGLLSVAVDDSRIFLRRSERVEVSRAGGHGRCATHCPDISVSTDSESREDTTSPTRCSSRRAGLLPVFTTRWRQETTLLLPYNQSQLFRVHPRGGAQASLIFSGGQRGGGSGAASCQADFVALSPASATLVHAREYGTELTAVQHVPFDNAMIINATCMDDWGPSCSIVGFSDGSLRVVDWRSPPPPPAAGAFAGAAAASSSSSLSLLATQAPQPRWLGTRRRSSLVFASTAGVVSCCALADSFRVVCGLGDAAGTVAVADLRKPEAPTHTKRSRRSTEDRLTASLFADVSTQTVTGRVVTDICHDPDCFGRLGFVDVAGTATVTHIAVLEGVRDDAQPCASSTTALPSITEESSNSDLSAPSRRRGRLPSPPQPWELMHRSSERGSATTQQASRAEAASDSQRSVATTPARPRCIFTGDGGFLVHTEDPITTRGSMRACFRPVMTATRAGRTGRRLETTSASSSLLMTPSLRPRATAAAASPCVAVSSVDRLVCFDTADGNTLSLFV